MAAELEYDLWDTMDWNRKWLVDSDARKTQFVLFNQSYNTGPIDVTMDGSVLEEKSFFKMLGLSFCSKLDWHSCIISIAQTAFKKIGALICLMKCLSLEVAVYLHKSTIWSCMEYCCNFWVCAPSYYLEMLDKLQKQICRTVGPSLAASFEPLVPLPYYWGRSTCYSDRLHDFLSPLRDVIRMSTTHRILFFDLWSKWFQV